MDEINKNLIRELQDSLPLCENPYEELGSKLGIKEDEVIRRLEELKMQGKLKRIGAILKHQKSGYSANAMVVFEIDNKSIDRIGRLLAQSPSVSHCYERRKNEKWNYNLYAMIHSKELNEIERFVHEFTNTNGIKVYDVLESQEELKKTSMIYFE